MAKPVKQVRPSIARNKKAGFNYFIEERFEAGLALQGWEVKSLRAGKAQLSEAYVTLKDGEIWLFGSHVTPLSSASTHVDADPARTRKLLMHRREIDRLTGLVERRGFTLVPPRTVFGSRAGRRLDRCGLATKGERQQDKARSGAKDARLGPGTRHGF